MTAEKNNKIEEFINQSVLASPPDLLFKIINSLDAELSSKQIGEIIGHDQTISAQVLKLSNSSFFGFKGQIKTLDKAINILGTKTIRNIAVTTLLFSHTNKVKLWNLDIMTFWLHAFLVADITREFCSKLKMNGDEGYIAGLLHDIGKLILYSREQEPNDLFSDVHTKHDIMEYEKKVWNFTSLEVSQFLLNKWNIPKDIITSISEHQNYHSHDKRALLVLLADEFSSIVTDEKYKSKIDKRIFTGILNELSLNEQEFLKYFAVVPDIVRKGKMIMQMMGTKNTFIPTSKQKKEATLVTTAYHSFARCLLELCGFEVSQVSPVNIPEYQHRTDIPEIAKLKSKKTAETGSVTGIFNIKSDKNEEINTEESGLTGFFKRIFFQKEKSARIESVKRPSVEVKPVDWQPFVIFENISPCEVSRKDAKIYFTTEKDSPDNPGDLPFFFSCYCFEEKNEEEKETK